MSNLNVLILGASDNTDRYSFKAEGLLLQLGHSVFLVANKKKISESRQIQDIFPSEQCVDVICLYVSPINQRNWYVDILNSNAKKVIFNPGTENPELQIQLSNEGIEWEEACTLVLLQTGQFP